MGYETAPADGAFYAFVKVCGDDREIANRWLEQGHVATMPGSAFYAPGWIRLSYATSMEKLKEAMGRIQQAWRALTAAQFSSLFFRSFLHQILANVESPDMTISGPVVRISGLR